jgi:hypothetical protein
MPVDTAEGVDSGALQRLYGSDSSAKDVLDHLAGRERNWSETTVDRLARNVWNEGSSASRADIIAALRGLEDAGCGRFIVGRGGYPSRFQWHVGMVEVGRRAAGRPAVIEQVDPEAPSDIDGEPESPGEQPTQRVRDITHAFQLRPDMLVSITLPADLTPTEAVRLGGFLRTLPFGIGEED